MPVLTTVKIRFITDPAGSGHFHLLLDGAVLDGTEAETIGEDGWHELLLSAEVAIASPELLSLRYFGEPSRPLWIDWVELNGERIADSTVAVPAPGQDNTLVLGFDTSGGAPALFTQITGSTGGDWLTGTSGADVIDGGKGADVMAGGAGDDVYYVDRVMDEVTEAAGEGVDTVHTSAQGRLADNVENMVITGTWTGARYYANALDNDITGSHVRNWIDAGDGNDVIRGGGGDDSIGGGAGIDTAMFSGAFASYEISRNAYGNIKVRALDGDDGTDMVSDVEYFRFADGLYEWAGDAMAPVKPPEPPQIAVASAAGVEDGAIALDISVAMPSGSDGRTLAVVIGGVPAGARLSAGIDNGDGSWTLAGADLAGLTLSPAADSDADLTLTVTAQLSDTVTGLSTSASAAAPVTVHAVADAPLLSVVPASGTEDAAIALDIAAALADLDGSESLTLVIAGLPDGAALSAGTRGADGRWTLGAADLAGLVLLPPPNFSGAITLEITARAGESELGVGAAETVRSLAVAIAAQADAPILVVPEDLSAQADGANSTRMSLAIDAALVDVSGSETLTVAIAGLPAGATLSAGVYNPDGSWTLMADELTGLELVLPAAFCGALDLSVTATARESNGTSASAVAAVGIEVIAPALQPEPGETITGTDSNDTLIGTGGDDILIGSGAADTMVGGAGDDTYHARGGDLVVEVADGGTDTAHVSSQGRLADNVENMVITGTWEAARYYANALDNTITGNEVRNLILAEGGDDTVTGGGGDDSMNGGDGADTAIYSGNLANYEISENQYGNFVVKDLAGGDGTDTLSNFEFLQFADQTFQIGEVVAVTTPPAATTPPPDEDQAAPAPESGGGSAGLIKPQVIQPQGPDDVVGLRLENGGDSGTGPQILTFGQSFARGDLSSGGALVALIDGEEVPLQLDVKARWEDGSVRHAVMSVQAPALAAGGHADVMLSRGQPAALPDLDISTLLGNGYDLALDVTLLNADGSRTPVSIDVAALLAEAVQSGEASRWLDGPLATEIRVEADINPHMTASFDVRLLADGSVRTDVRLANDSIYTAGNRTFVYDAAIREGGEIVFAREGVEHYPNANWHKAVWAGEAPSGHVVQDVEYLIATGAIQAYDTSIGIDSAEIAGKADSLAASDTDILGNALVEQFMPATGGRAEIGAAPTWAALYLASQDAQARDVMLTNADVSGSIPWHFIDEATGEAVRIDDHPRLWLDPRGTKGSDAPAFQVFAEEDGWAVDTAHQPALGYSAYLVTGDHYYLDELVAQASFTVASRNPDYRQDSLGIFDGDQIRAQAWTFRTLSDAAYVLPDDHPLKAYFNDQLQNNLDHYIEKYVTGGIYDAAGEVEGWLQAYNIRPWMQDFFPIVLNQLVQRGYDDAGQLLDWMGNFLAGRFINGDNGFDPMEGVAYGMEYYDPVTGQPYSTWSELFEGSFGADPTPRDTIDGYPNLPGGYAAYAKASMASLISGTGSPDAIEAYGFLVANTTKMPAKYADDPTFSVTPRLADGSYLSNEDMHVTPFDGDAAMAGTDRNELLHGGIGDNGIDGAAGIDLLFGGEGNDRLGGGEGNDYLFGGKGADRIEGGRGDDYLKGNSGADVFVYGAGDTGRDTIADFDYVEDRIELDDGLGLSVATVLGGATVDSAGNAVLHLGDGNEIVLLGVAPQHLDSGLISMN